MNVLPLAALALGIVLLGLVSRKIERVFLTPPLVFVAFGFLLGADVLGIAAFEIHAPFIHRLAEWTLVLVLFTDAARIDLRSIQREHDLPLRLLLIGLPLTITAGAVLGHWLFPALGFAGAALLASILAPTDAALGDAVLHDTRVPVRVRQSLNVESGLNDGLAVPSVLFFTVLAGASHDPARDWVRFILTQLALGPLIGAAVGALGGIAVERAVAAGWMSGAFQRLAGPALAFLAWSAALLAGGNGFIAAFVAGLAMGHFARNACGVLHAFGEAEGQLLALITFVLFGAAMVPFALAHATPAIWLYALTSLTLIRMIPVALALTGTGLRVQTTGFLGWFGPRGLASVVFGLALVESPQFPAKETLLATVGLTVVLSVILHGVTSAPLARAYGAWCGRHPGESPEHRTVTEMPTRRSGASH
jgi:NhaP-type Na+/H+ or K+/H+ antiporter